MEPEEPARKLPPQDDAAIDEMEKAARNVTLGVAATALAILMLIVCFVWRR